VSARIHEAVLAWSVEYILGKWAVAPVQSHRGPMLSLEIRHGSESRVVNPLDALVWALAMDAGTPDVALSQCDRCHGRGDPILRTCATRADAELTAGYRRSMGHPGATAVEIDGRFMVSDRERRCEVCHWDPLPVLVFRACSGLGQAVDLRLPVIADQLQAQGHPLGLDLALWLAGEFKLVRLVWPDDGGLPRCS
jgi:hypothetical protein